MKLKRLINMNTPYKLFCALYAVLFTACVPQDKIDDIVAEPEPEEMMTTPVTNGTADFTRFVAVGNSLTAGFADGALFKAGQENSMPNIMAQQFALAGGGEFKQPLMNDNTGGGLLAGMPILGPRLFFNGAGPVPLPAAPTTEISNILSAPFNNLGVPGAKSFHLVANGYGNIQGLAQGLANPYFVRMASSPNASVLEDAIAQNPTFFSLWIGNNDVLGYATSGGDGTDPITDTTLFTQAYNAIVNGLTANGAKGVAFNIPNVTAIPHFTTVPHNPVPLDAATAAAVNGAYAQYNAGIVQALGGLVLQGIITQEIADAEIEKRTINFTAGEGNAVVILDENLIDLTALNPALVNMRQATKDDLLVLPSSSFIGTLADPQNPLSVNGVAIPLADKWVLTPQEQAELANLAMQKINETYGSTLPMAKALDYPVAYPAMLP